MNVESGFWPTIWSLLRATIVLQFEYYCSTDPLRVYAVSDRLNIRDLLAGEATNIGLVPASILWIWLVFYNTGWISN